MEEDEIVDIPANRVKFFGTTGKMLLPSFASVAALVEQVPPTQIITTAQLTKQLTAQFGVQGTCPVTTKKALHTIASDSQSKIAYWRVLNQNGGLVATYPGGIEAHAAYLRQEGFTIDLASDNPKVKDFRTRSYRFQE